VERWHVLKFLCQELSRKEADSIGKAIADLKSVSEKDLAALKLRILTLLRRPSEIRRIKQSLWKNYAFLKKHFGIESDRVGMPEDERSMSRIAGELLALELITEKAGQLFGSVPIHYRRPEKPEAPNE
jgi:hypothetical protein